MGDLTQGGWKRGPVEEKKRALSHVLIGGGSGVTFLKHSRLLQEQKGLLPPSRMKGGKRQSLLSLEGKNPLLSGGGD